MLFISGYMELLNAQLHQITYPSISMRKVGQKTYEDNILTDTTSIRYFEI